MVDEVVATDADEGACRRPAFIAQHQEATWTSRPPQSYSTCDELGHLWSRPTATLRTACAGVPGLGATRQPQLRPGERSDRLLSFGGIGSFQFLGCMDGYYAWWMEGGATSSMSAEPAALFFLNSSTRIMMLPLSQQLNSDGR